MDPMSTLAWVVTVFFAITAGVTLLGIIESPRLIQLRPQYLKALFTALVLELVAVVVFMIPSAMSGASRSELKAKPRPPASVADAWRDHMQLLVHPQILFSVQPEILDAMFRSASVVSSRIEQGTRAVLPAEVPANSIEIALFPLDVKEAGFELQMTIRDDMNKVVGHQAAGAAVRWERGHRETLTIPLNGLQPLGAFPQFKLWIKKALVSKELFEVMAPWKALYAITAVTASGERYPLRIMGSS
jgi:hypothetical protein